MRLYSISKDKRLDRDAAAYFLLMCRAAGEAGIMLSVNSAYRSTEYQAGLYAHYQQECSNFLLGKRKTKPAVVAKPGTSAHEKGNAIDINRAPGDNPATSAPDSPIDVWLNNYAHLFGFKRTVPSEPWHWEWSRETLDAAST